MPSFDISVHIGETGNKINRGKTLGVTLERTLISRVMLMYCVRVSNYIDIEK